MSQLRLSNVGAWVALAGVLGGLFLGLGGHTLFRRFDTVLEVFFLCVLAAGIGVAMCVVGLWIEWWDRRGPRRRGGRSTGPHPQEGGRRRRKAAPPAAPTETR